MQKVYIFLQGHNWLITLFGSSEEEGKGNSYYNFHMSCSNI